MTQNNHIGKAHFSLIFTPLEIMPRCSAAGLDSRIIPAGFNAPPVESLWVERLEFLTGFTLYLFSVSLILISCNDRFASYNLLVF